MLTLINPCLVCHRGDAHSSGIPYLPHGLSYLCAVLEKAGIPTEVIDSFGEAPNSARKTPSLLLLGLSPSAVTGRISAKTKAIVIYANSVFNSYSAFELAKAITETFPRLPLFFAENTQAVTGFSLLRCEAELRHLGNARVILGESEAIAPQLFSQYLNNGIIGEDLRRHIWHPSEVSKGKVNAFVSQLDDLPFPEWKRFPLENYWRIRYAHGPASARYLALLTSRGCPYPCGFCSVPVMNKQSWRARTALNVVSEIEQMKSFFDVHEFHWEDLNPTINEQRIVDLCSEMIARKLDIRWKIVSGTKMDNLKMETLELMARAGLKYISFSPESGSKTVLSAIRKPFKHEHALAQVRRLKELRVDTQACFVLGYPGESEEDRQKTRKYSGDLVRAGLSEVAYFIVAPMPGTIIENAVGGLFNSLSDLTFSPSWRVDYRELKAWRDSLYLRFFVDKLCYFPLQLLQSSLRALWGDFHLKMEMFPLRRLKTFLLNRRAPFSPSPAFQHSLPQKKVAY